MSGTTFSGMLRVSKWDFCSISVFLPEFPENFRMVRSSGIHQFPDDFLELFPREYHFYPLGIFRQELHASPHLEHIPILSYPYISIYRTSWPYMDIWASMKFWPIFRNFWLNGRRPWFVQTSQPIKHVQPFDIFLLVFQTCPPLNTGNLLTSFCWFFQTSQPIKPVYV